jgi:hypothetical protein
MCRGLAPKGAANPEKKNDLKQQHITSFFPSAIVAFSLYQDIAFRPQLSSTTFEYE